MGDWTQRGNTADGDTPNHAERMAAIRQRVKASIDDPRPSMNADEVMRRLQVLHAAADST